MPGFRSKEYRPLTFVADWKRSIPYVTEFDRMADDDLDEPHLKRKRAILNNHPHVTELYGIEPHTKYLLAVLLAVQLSIAYYVGHNNINSILHAVIVYVVGASLTQIFGTVIHEACHNLTAKSPLANRIIALVANIPIPFPIAASFRRYHLEHHAHQGIYDKDPDLPLPWEIQFAKGNPIFKALFLFFYPLMYVVRGIAMNKAPSNWELINIAWTITTDVILYRFLGHDGFMYLFYSLWFGYGIHPAAAHFIQEHYTWVDGQETYSYYGLLNYPFLNIGYHVEHHDFTQIAWTNIKKLRELAPEFYNTQFYHMSWTRVILEFIFDWNLGPQSRLGRTNEAQKRGRALDGDVGRCDSGIIFGGKDKDE